MARLYRSPVWPLVAVLVGLYFVSSIWAKQEAPRQVEPMDPETFLAQFKQAQDAASQPGPADSELAAKLKQLADPTVPGNAGDSEIHVIQTDALGGAVETVVRRREGETTLELLIRSKVLSKLAK